MLQRTEHKTTIECSDLRPGRARNTRACSISSTHPSSMRGRATTKLFVAQPQLPDFCSPFLLAFFRSSLFGLHFWQDFPSLWAAAQHLCRHSFPSLAASWQQVSLPAGFSAAKVELVIRLKAHTSKARARSGFIQEISFGA